MGADSHFIHDLLAETHLAQEVRLQVKQREWLMGMADGSGGNMASTSSDLSMISHPDNGAFDPNDGRLSGTSVQEVIRSRARMMFNHYDLRTMLSRLLKGKQVMLFYSRTHKLDEKHRRYLCDIVVDEELKENESLKISFERLDFIGDQIVNLFPTENKMAWINRKEYPNGASQLSGRLYNKYYNSRRRSKTSNPAEPGAIPEAGSSFGSEPEVVAADDETSGCIVWLECSTKPWETVRKFWQKTAKCRMSQLRQGGDVFEYMARFLALKQPAAYELIDIDFTEAWPDRAKALYTEWPTLVPFFIKRIGDRVKGFLQDGNYSMNDMTLHVLMNLSKMFSSITVNKKSKDFPEWKSAKSETQDAFFVHVEDFQQLEEKIEQRREKLSVFNLPLQPVAVAVGPVERPTQFLVVFDNYRFEVTSPLQAIDIAYKAYHVLNIPYPPESQHVWLWFQKAVFNMEFAKQRRFFTRTSSLLAEYTYYKSLLPQPSILPQPSLLPQPSTSTS